MYYDILDQLDGFTDEEFGKIVKALIIYDRDGILPELDRSLMIAFNCIRPSIDRNKEEYESKCEMQRKKIQDYWDSKKIPLNTTEYNSIQMNTMATDNDIDNDKEKDKDIDKVNEIFNYWNSKNIITHKKITDNIIKTIKKTLKLYLIDSIKVCIDRYATVINDKNYFFDYKWTLQEFLTRKDGISSFTEEGSKWINYKNQTSLQQPRLKKQDFFEKERQEYMRQVGHHEDDERPF